KRASQGKDSALAILQRSIKSERLEFSYRRRLLLVGTLPGNLISCPACNSTSGWMPLRCASSSTDNLCAAAILAIVSPLRARTFVRLEALAASEVFAGARRV